MNNLEFSIVKNNTKSYKDSKPTVSITFDDGPNPYSTPIILDILRDEEVKATFFVIGRWVEKYPELTRQILREGHIIGGHTYSHGGENGNESWGDFDKGNICIKTITNCNVQHIRVPQFGYKTLDVIDGVSISRVVELTKGYLANSIKERKIKVIDCSINPNDWNKFIPAWYIKRYILSRLHPGAIICLHDGSEKEVELLTRANRTVRILKDTIRSIKQKGYIFTQVDTD